MERKINLKNKLSSSTLPCLPTLPTQSIGRYKITESFLVGKDL